MPKQIRQTQGSSKSLTPVRRMTRGRAISTQENQLDKPIYTEQLNPLMIPLILDILFGFLKPRELKQCRGVCKLWFKVSFKYVQSQFVVRLKDGVAISQFTDLMKSTILPNPFEKFNLGCFPSLEGALAFAKAFGAQAKTIRFHSWSTYYHYIEDVSMVLSFCSVLEHLGIPSYLRTRPRTRSALGITGQRLFPSKIPQLTSLKTIELEEEDYVARKQVCPTLLSEIFRLGGGISKIDSNSRNGGDFELIMIVYLYRLQSSLQSLSLNHVNLTHWFWLKQMTLEENGPKLKSLKIENGDRNMVWLRVVTLFRSTLTSLSIQGSIEISTQLNIEFPHLESLDLRISNTSCRSMEFSDFNKNFPVLKELKLSTLSRQHVILDNFLTSNVVRAEGEGPQMKTLILSNLIMTPVDLTLTARNFPNLTELRIVVSTNVSDTLSKIWTHLDKLVKLNIFGKLATDDQMDLLLTGLSMRELKKIKRQQIISLSGMTESKRREEIDRWIQRHGRFPSIRSLTGLRHLKLNMIALGGQNQRLTDLTAYLAFYPMKSLRHLRVSRCEISKSCCEVLSSEMNLLSWVMEDDVHNEIIPSKYK